MAKFDVPVRQTPHIFSDSPSSPLKSKSIFLGPKKNYFQIPRMDLFCQFEKKTDFSKRTTFEAFPSASYLFFYKILRQVTFLDHPLESKSVRFARVLRFLALAQCLYGYWTLSVTTVSFFSFDCLVTNRQYIYKLCIIRFGMKSE